MKQLAKFRLLSFAVYMLVLLILFKMQRGDVSFMCEAGLCAVFK
jgi:hypothetical protein